MVHLYATDIRSLPDPKEYPEILYGIDSQRKDKTMKYLQADDRKRCLGAGLLLGKILPLYGESPEKITLGPQGKPEAEKTNFNISHSSELVICAVGEKAVGCDIEKVGKEQFGVAERFFHRNEVEYLQALEEGMRNEMFFRLWTLKESYIKMTGEGLHLPLHCFEILWNRNQDGIQVRRDGKILSCHIQEYDIPGYKVSVCAEEQHFSDDVKYIYP